MEQFFFYAFAIIAVLCAVCVVTLRNPVHSAFFLILTLLQVAAIFILLRAPFLAAVQVFIYVGAVMVLFLFAVLVLDLGRERMKEYIHQQSPPAVAAVVVLFITAALLVLKARITAPPGRFDEAALANNTEVVGRALFTTYIFPFEVVSVLLLVALIGAVALVLRERTGAGDGGRG